MENQCKEGLVPEVENAVTEAEERLAVADAAVEEGEAVDRKRIIEEEEEENAAIHNGIGSYGDSLIDAISVEANVEKIHRLVRLPKTVAAYVVAALYILAGAACVAFPHAVESALPYIVGSLIGVASLVQFVVAMATKEYKKTDTNKTASSLIYLALSIMIILEHEWAHVFIPIVWGILGLCEGAHAFNHALARISHGMRCAYYIVKGFVEVTIAFLLLYKPATYAEVHIIVFGISLILDGVSTLPFIKKFINR